MHVQQSEDKAHFITRLASKYTNSLVLDLLDEMYYKCDFGMSHSSQDVGCELEPYTQWLQVFVETHIELTQQSRIRTILSIENLRHSLNEIHHQISLTYRDRTLPENEAWKKIQVILLVSDDMGFPTRVVITQENLHSALCSHEDRFFNSNLYGVIQFGINQSDKTNWWDFSYLNINEKAASISGYSLDEFYEGLLNDQIYLVASSDIIVFRDLLTSLETVGQRSEFHVHTINRSGDLILVGGEAELCRDDDGRKFVQLIFIDETSVESQLSVIEELKKEIKDFSETVPCAIHRSLMAGKSTTEYVNRNFTLITGYDCIDLQEKFGGVLQSILATPEDVKNFNSAASRALTSGERVMVDLKVQHSDGSIIMVRDWLNVVHDKRDRLWLYGAMIEYTDEKRAQSKVELYGRFLDYYRQSNSAILKLIDYIYSKNPEKASSEDISVQNLTDFLSQLTDSSVILFQMDDEKKLTKAANYCIKENDPVGEPICLRYEAMKANFEEIGTMDCTVIPNPVVIKSYMKPEFYSQTISPDLIQFIVMPVEYRNNRLYRFYLFRNPPEWLMFESIPKTISETIRLSYKFIDGL